MFRSAVCRLKWYASIRQRGTNMNDHSLITRHHSPQSGERSIHIAKVCHICHALEFLRGHLFDRRKYGCHCIVDPDIDRTKLVLNLLSSLLDLFRVGDIHRQRQGFPPNSFDILPGAFQPVGSPCKQTQMSATLRKEAGCGASHTSRCAGDDYDFIL